MLPELRDKQSSVAACTTAWMAGTSLAMTAAGVFGPSKTAVNFDL
jgi:hypothetical protein